MRSVCGLLKLRSQVCLGSLVAIVKQEGPGGFEELSLLVGMSETQRSVIVNIFYK